MDALTALHTRNSANLLEEPGPDASQLNNIIKAGLRACDHKDLHPWQFIVIEGEARNKFGDLMAEVKFAIDEFKTDKKTLDKIRQKPMRAPTIIAVVARITEHDKVPEIEQILSAGASAQMMVTAAFAQNLGAIWRSGSLMFRAEMREGLSLRETDRIVGFIYIGTPKTLKPLPNLDPEDFVKHWS